MMNPTEWHWKGEDRVLLVWNGVFDADLGLLSPARDEGKDL
jgi:hypothetical protein